MRIATERAPEIFELIKKGVPEQVAEWLDRDPGLIHARMPNGFEPLHWAALWNQGEIVELLLDRGADVNSKTQHGGMTPLYFTTAIPVAGLLLARGADVNARDDRGRTPLHRAAWENYPEMADFLLQHGAELNSRDRSDMTPLGLALASGANEVARVLQERGAIE